MFAVRLHAVLAGVTTSRPARRLTTALAHVLLFVRALVPGRWLQKMVLAFIRMEAACCRSDTPHYKFVQRYLDQFERAGTVDRMRTSLARMPRSHAARRLDAWTRIGLLGNARHELLTRALGKGEGALRVPPRLLMEAQLALSPGCDLTCEGCYTNEDRGGKAPSRERIAYLVDEVVACGAFAVHVIGKGEPFLSPKWANDLLDVIEERSHVFFTIATHAMHIDDVLAERIGRLGNLVLLVAIDGDEAIHDARRGAGSYRRVHEALARLRKHHAVFGFSCMVSAKSLAALTSDAYVEARAESGAAIGIYSRYFPLTSGHVEELALDAESLAAYRRRFEAAREKASITLLDLDDVEQHTGCHSRAGESIYVDGMSGRVAPCLRVPFAPETCVLDGVPGRLAEILAHAYFVAYRSRSTSCPSWCGANLEGELAEVGALLDAHVPRLVAYEARARGTTQRRRLPLLVDAEP